MKVAIITNYWKNSDGGGVRNYVVNLVEGLKENKVNVIVLFREGEDFEQFRGTKNKILFVISCFSELLRCKPSAIHSHGTWYCLLPGVIYKKICGCTLVHTFHTEPVRRLPLLGRMFFLYLLKTCDWVTFVSKGLQRKIEETDGFVFPRTAITYAGVKAGEVTDDEIRQFCERFGIGKDTIVLLAQAFTAHKLKAEGLKILIRSIGFLREKYPNILLIATREGKYSNELKHFTRELGLEKHVIFTGDVENPFVPIVLCNVFVFPWLGMSGVGIALLEAMSMGKPIVTTSIDGFSEAIINGKNGLIVEPNADKIAERIDFLIKNREYAKRLGEKARETVEERFRWEQTIKQLIIKYKE